MQFIVSPGCKTSSGETLALSATSDTNITVELASNVTPNIVWTLLYSISLNGFLLVNNASGKALNANPDRLLNLVAPDTALTNTSAWNAAGDNATLAVRPMSDFGLNLNVVGDGPYNPGNPVCVWPWSGGDPNEVWNFTLVEASVPYGWFHTLSPACKAPMGVSLALSLNDKDDYGQVAVATANESDDRQLWTPVYYLDNVNRGIVFINKHSGRALQTTLSAGPVYTASLDTLDTNSLWTLGDAEGFVAVQPAYISDVALNVLGNGPYNSGTPVAIWPWSGAQPNEIWNATLIGSRFRNDEIVVTAGDGYYYCVLPGETGPQVCSIQVMADATDLSFRVSDIQSNLGAGFYVSDPDGIVYDSSSSGENGVWALEAKNVTLGLESFYIANPKAGAWEAHLRSKGVTRPWDFVGSTNMADSGVAAAGAFADLPAGKQQAIYSRLSPQGPTFDPVPPEFCYFCIAQGYVLGALLIATFVFWNGTVTPTSAIVLYAQRLLGARTASLVIIINQLYTIWNTGGPSSTMYNLVRKLCELEGFCKKP